jgi:ABC-type branched-subunit amino acid transport system substrate-binding protein
MILSIALAPVLLHMLRAQAVAAIPEAAEKGRQIYLHGTGTSKISATFGNGSGSVSASIVPCAGCHGANGTGRTEAGITSPDIRWPVLSRPTPSGDSTLKQRPGYTKSTLLRAIGLGIDSAGVPLGNTMPHYQLSAVDAANLLAWMENRSILPEPGLSDDSIRIGMLVPPAEFMDRGASSAARDAVSAYAEEANRTGFYGRHLEIVTFDLPEDRNLVSSTLAEWLRRNHIFVVVSSFLCGLDKPVSRALADAETPLIGAISPNPLIGPQQPGTVFYLDGGLAGQAEALVDQTVSTPPAAQHLAILISASGLDEELATALAGKAAAAGWVPNVVASDDPSPQIDADVVLTLRPGVELGELCRNWRSSAGSRLLLVPGLLQTDRLRNSQSSVVVAVQAAYPFLPADYAPAASSNYARISAAHHLDAEHRAAQIAAIASLEILMEALRRAGRDLSREALVEAVESISRFETGWTPPISFGLTRRTGIEDFHIVEITSGSR